MHVHEQQQQHTTQPSELDQLKAEITSLTKVE